MATEYVFTAGQLYAMYQALGLGSARDVRDHEKRAWLMHHCEFTVEEKADPDLQYENILGELGEPDRISFTAGTEFTVTRKFTARQKKKLIEVCKDTWGSFRSSWIEQWLKPALIVLGYEFKEVDWGDDDDE